MLTVHCCTEQKHSSYQEKQKQKQLLLVDSSWQMKLAKILFMKKCTLTICDFKAIKKTKCGFTFDECPLIETPPGFTSVDLLVCMCE